MSEKEIWETASNFIMTHWQVVSFGTVASIGGYLLRFSSWFKQKKIKKYARMVRDYADQMRRKEPNIHCFNRSALAAQLGSGSKCILDVLEFMEEKKWATKLRFPVDCWRIGTDDFSSSAVSSRWR